MKTETININKKVAISSVIVVFALIISALIFGSSDSRKSTEAALSSTCKFSDLTFYYIDGCSWCSKVKSDGSLDKLRAMRVNVTEINARTGRVKHDFKGVPTFVIDDEVITGYRTFEELIDLLGCGKEEDGGAVVEVISSSEEENIEDEISEESGFSGDKGETVYLSGGKIEIETSSIDDDRTSFFNADIGDRTVYFFVVRDGSGVYRAAANACEVCFGEKKGFRREGDYMVCDNCGNKYSLEKIGTEKGGCNPGPISPNLKVAGGKIIINEKDISDPDVLRLFN
jgi:hypothetical protein